MIPITKTLTAPLKAVGIADSFTPMSNKIPQLWDTFLPRLAEIAHQSAADISFGICFDETPSFITQQNPDELLFVYMAAVQVDEFQEPLPEGMVSTLIPAGTYAVFTHKGSLATFHQTLAYIYQQWMPTAPRKAGLPDFEWYDHRFSPNSPHSEIDVYIPIETN